MLLIFNIDRTNMKTAEKMILTGAIQNL